MRGSSGVPLALALFLFLLALARTGAAAQDVPRVEVFGGVSYLRKPISMGHDNNLVGWQAGPDINFSKNVALAFDFGGQYRSFFGFRLSRYEYAAGPRFKYRHGRTAFFVHGLVGGDYEDYELGTKRGAALLGAGGGVDLNLSDRLAIRVMQFDSLHDHTPYFWGHALRVGIGLVFKAGRR
jgi:hypothetical protein